MGVKRGDSSAGAGIRGSAGRVWREFMPVKYSSDVKGPKAGIPYDGRLTRADGKGTWWEGMYPQDHYGPVHTVNDPCPEFVQQYLMRVDDLIRQHHPDLICLDGNAWGSTSPSGSGRAGVAVVAPGSGPS